MSLKIYYHKKLIKFFFNRAYCTNKKRVNLILATIHWKIFKNTKLFSYPIRMMICPGNVCNLRCVLCPTGKKDPHRKPGLMSFSTFKKIIDECGPYLYTLDLYNWGEPLLNKDIFLMIRYAKKYKIEVIINSTLNHFDTSMANQLIESGLDTLIVSIDGASQQSVQKYQTGMNFAKAIQNMKQIIASKKKFNSKKPLIQWRYLVNKYNESEIDIAKSMAKELSVDKLEIAAFRCDMGKELLMDNQKKFKNVLHWLPKNEALSMYNYTTEGKKQLADTCSWLWLKSVVNWNGSVVPCCAVWNEKYDFGNINEQTFKNIWNGKKYVSARKIFVNPSSQDRAIICSICKNNQSMI